MTLPATDAFTGADGTNLTTYSASWSYTPYASNKFFINTNAIYSTFSVDLVQARWNADTFANDQYSQVKMAAVFSGTYPGPAVRIAAAADTAYYIEVDSNDGSYLYKRVTGTETQLGSAGGVAVANQVWRLEASSTTITPKNDGSTTGTPGAQTDSAISSGYAGISCWGSSTSSRIDDWEGGNLSAGEGTGTLAVTLGAVTLGAAGAHPIVGTLAVTLGALTLGAAGKLAGTGTLAGTLGAATLSAAGGAAALSPITGTLAVTLGAATLGAAGVLMSPKTYYLTETLAGTSQHLAIQDGGTAPTFARQTTGWIVGTAAPTLYARMDSAFERLATAHTSTVQPNGAPDNTLGDCFRTDLLAGTFANANWTFNFEVQGQTRTTSTHDGRLRIRMWRSVNQDGSSAVEITGATQVTSDYANLANTAVQAISLSYNPGAVTLANEYLFVQIAHELTGAGSNAGSDTHLCSGTNNSIVTAAFIPNGTGTLNATLDAVALSAAGALPIVGTSTPTLGAMTVAAAGALAGTGTLAATLGALTLSATGAGALSPIASSLAATLGAVTSSGAGALAIKATAAPTLGAMTLSAAGYALSGACIGGVLTVNTTNPRYFQNSSGILALTGFHTWYDLADGGVSDPPPVFDYDAWLNFCDGRGGNAFKLWAMETTKDWPDELNTRYTPNPFARTGPGNAADGYLKFDLTQFNQGYFDRLRERVIKAGNRGYYVIVQLFQGWQVAQKGMGTGTPWLYHPMENGNNINSIDGDTNNDGDGLETRSTAFTAVYNIQKSYVEKVIDTINDLDNVLFEVSNEETSSATVVLWQQALVDYIHTYEAGKAKQHPVGMTWLWPGGDNADLDASNAEWVSWGGNDSTPLSNPPAWADTKAVSLWDTDHMGGLVLDPLYVWRAFTRGHNILFMDSYDGTFGDDWTANATAEEIRYNLGYIQNYVARVDLANMTPQGALASTGYCLAKTTGLAKLIAYQPASGAFTVTLTGIAGTFSLEWLRVGTGTIQADSNVAGNGVRTLTPPWATEDVVAFLELIGVDGSLAVTLGALTVAAAGKLAMAGNLTVTLGAMTVAAAGKLAGTGTLSATLGTVTLSATGGAPAMAGSLTVTLDALTVAAAGKLAGTGTLSATLGTVTLSATGGAPAMAGSLTVTLDALTVAAAGKLAGTGTLAETLGALTLTSTGGAPAMAGTLASTLGAATLSAAGKLAGTGSLTATLGAVTLSAAGLSFAVGSGVLAVTLGALTVAGAGALSGPVGTLARTLDAATLAAAGMLAGTGALERTLGDVTLAATGVSAAGPTGALAATLGAVTVAGAGALAIGGAASVTLGDVSLSGAAALASTGSLAGTLGAVTLSGIGVELVIIAIVYGSIRGAGGSGFVRGAGGAGTVRGGHGVSRVNG